MADFSKILVVNLGGIGDFLLSEPSLRSLKAVNPGSVLSVLIIPRVKEIAAELPYIDKVYCFEMTAGPIQIIKNIRVLFFLRKQGFDLAVNMRTIVSWFSVLKIRALFDFINPKMRAGRDTCGRGDFFEIKIPESDIGDKYEMSYDLDLAAALGAKADSREIEFPIKKESFARVERILDAQGISGGDLLIGVNLGGKPSHQLPIRIFFDVIEALYLKTGAKFVVTAEKKDRKMAGYLIERSRAKVFDLSGKVNLSELGAMIKRCDLYISNDTANMHIAAILEVPLVAIFGAGFLTRFDPRNISPKAVVIQKPADCAPCNKVNCRSLKCLKTITADEIARESLILLKTIGKGIKDDQ